MILLDGKLLSAEIRAELALEVEKVKQSGHRAPHLAAMLIGNDGASETYVASKIKSCKEVGFSSTLIRFPESVTEQEVIRKIEEVNQDENIDGLIVQLPVPKHISVRRITETIVPSKDVDGFHPVNIGRMLQNIPGYLPATPYGILQIIERYKIPTEGKHCVVLGRSNIVGLPMSILMGRNNYPGNCTVTLCHSKSADLKGITAKADILIAAIGKPRFVTADMVKPGAVVIDVGITREPSALTKSGYKLFGDVHFDEVAPMCSYITPVPGGVGLMTIVSLLENTMKAARKEFSY